MKKEELRISRSTVVRILHDAGIRSKKGVRRAKLHCSRPRKEAAGMLRQTDATSFPWLARGTGVRRAARLH